MGAATTISLPVTIGIGDIAFLTNTIGPAICSSGFIIIPRGIQAVKVGNRYFSKI